LDIIHFYLLPSINSFYLAVMLTAGPLWITPFYLAVMLTAGTLIQIPARPSIPVEDVARWALALVGAEGVVALMLAGIWRLKFRNFENKKSNSRRIYGVMLPLCIF
jgi:hypothetical protein